MGLDIDAAMGARWKDPELMMSVRSFKEDRSGLELPDSSPNPNIASYNADRT